MDNLMRQLTGRQTMDLLNRVSSAINTNDDPHTTVGDIYHFEREIFLDAIDNESISITLNGKKLKPRGRSIKC